MSLCFPQKKKKKRSSRFLPEVNPLSQSGLFIVKGALSVSAGDAVAISSGLLQVVILKAVKRGRVALGGGAKQLLSSSKCPIFLFVSKVTYALADSAGRPRFTRFLCTMTFSAVVVGNVCTAWTFWALLPVSLGYRWSSWYNGAPLSRLLLLCHMGMSVVVA